MSFEILFPFGLWVFEPGWLLNHSQLVWRCPCFSQIVVQITSTRGPLGAVDWLLVPRLGLGELKFPSTPLHFHVKFPKFPSELVWTEISFHHSRSQRESVLADS